MLYDYNYIIYILTVLIYIHMSQFHFKKVFIKYDKFSLGTQLTQSAI